MPGPTFRAPTGRPEPIGEPPGVGIEFALRVNVKTNTPQLASAISPHEVSRGGDLDVWARHSWQEGVQIEELWPGDQLVLTTVNSVYDVTVVSPTMREVIISGGHFF